MKVGVAGTFNVIHKGHVELLKKAFEIGDMVYIGLTSNEMAEQHRGVTVQSYEMREKNLVETIQELAQGKEFQITKINDVYGPAVVSNFDAIIVSKETEDKAKGINKIRKKNGLKEIEIIVIDMVLAGDKKPITSTRILRGETDKGGRIKK